MNPRNDAVGLAERTRKNLVYIETAFVAGADVHVITQVVNSLLGLVVFPWERHFPNHVAQIPMHELSQQGWPSWQVNSGIREHAWSAHALLEKCGSSRPHSFFLRQPSSYGSGH